MSRQYSLIIVLWLFLAGLSAAAVEDSQQFLKPDQAFALSYSIEGANNINLSWQIAPGYYLYKKRLKAWYKEGEDRAVLSIISPEGELKNDPNFGEVFVFHNQLKAQVQLSNTDVKSISVQYQGCAEAGLCYQPQTRVISLEGSVLGSSSIRSVPMSEDEKISLQLAGSNRWLTVVTFFGIGLLLAFTPCVFPMVPILSSLIVGAGINNKRRAFILSSVYVLSMALAYAVAGVASGLLGGNIQSLMQHPIAIVLFASIFVLLSLSMFGFYEIQLPRGLQIRMSNISNRQAAGHYGGAAVMGLLSALIVGPCVAPPLAGALLYIGQTGDAVLGGIALFVLSLGMGLPLILVGTFAGAWLPKSGAWMERVKYLFGFAMLGFAIYLLDRILPAFITYWLYALWMFVIAYFVGVARSSKTSSKRVALLRNIVALVILGLGVLMALKPTTGSQNTEGDNLANKPSSHHWVDQAPQVEMYFAKGPRPVLVDVYADWCTACKTMEKQVYSSPEFQAATDDYEFITFDITEYHDENNQWLSKHHIVGPPALLYFADPTDPPIRLVGEKSLSETLDWLVTAAKVQR